MKFAIFAKHLQAWPLEECCSKVAQAGFQGLDLTVRDGGYIQPESALSDLPKAVKLINSFGLEVPLLTTGLLGPQSPHAQTIMAAAAQVGVRELKIHYWPYDAAKPLAGQIDEARKNFAGLVSMATKHNLRINLHNHSGFFLQNHASVVVDILKDHPPQHAGAYIDPAHFTLEGGLAAWKMSLDMVISRLTLLAIKDGKFIDPPNAAPGSPQPQIRSWVPVGKGNVRWKEVLSMTKAAGFTGWASIHGEYQGPGSWQDLSTQQVLDQCTQDRLYIASLLANLH